MLTKIFLRRQVRNVPVPTEVYSKTATYVFLQRDSIHKGLGHEFSRKQGEKQNAFSVAEFSSVPYIASSWRKRLGTCTPRRFYSSHKMFNRGPTWQNALSTYMSVLFQIQETVASCKSDLDINCKSDILSGTIISYKNVLILFSLSALIKSVISQGFFY